MNKGGADAQHGAQLADPNLPGPGQYNVKAAPVVSAHRSQQVLRLR